MTDTSPPSEEKELKLIDNLELRIALTDSENRLQSLLSTYLCPLLLKLKSPHQRVRDKVISVCQHINTRISGSSVQLPILLLLKQYKEHTNALLRHFDLLYVSQGIRRLSREERAELLPTIVSGISDNFRESPASTARLFNIFLRALHDFKAPPVENEEKSSLRAHFGFSAKPDDAQFLANWIAKIMLYRRMPPGQTCPGLSYHQSEFLLPNGDENTWNPDAGGLPLVETKVAALRLIASNAFVDLEKIQPALIASADNNSRLAELGEHITKRAIQTISLEDDQLIQDLYNIYLGRQGAESHSAAGPALQRKVLELLSKSAQAANFTKEIVQVVQAGLTSANSSGSDTGTEINRKGRLETLKLTNQVFSFTYWVARNATQSTLKEVAPTMIGALRLHIERQGWPRPKKELAFREIGVKTSRSYCYESIGLISRSCPEEVLLEPLLELLQWLFSSLGCDTSDKDITISIESAFASILGAFHTVLTPELETSLIKLLLHYTLLDIGDVDFLGNEMVRSTRFVAVRFANRSLPFHNVSARLIDLLALVDSERQRKEVLEEANKGLDPYWYRNMNPQDIIVSYQGANQDHKSERYGMPEPSALIDTLFNSTSPALPLDTAQPKAVIFCRSVLFHKALVASDRAPPIDVDWQRNLNALVLYDEEARLSIRDYLKAYQASAQSPLLRLVDAAFMALIGSPPTQAEDTGECLLQLCFLGPRWLLEHEKSRFGEISALAWSSSPSVRVIAACLLGWLSTGLEPVADEIQLIVKSFMSKALDWEHAIGHGMHEVHGSIIALAQLVSQDTNLCAHGNMKSEMSALTSRIICTGRDKDALDAALTAFGQLSLFGSFESTDAPPQLSMKAIIQRLGELSGSGNEKAIIALGRLAMQCPEENDDSHLVYILDTLYGLHEHRQQESQFAVGAALSCASVGWSSTSLVGVTDPERTECLAASRKHTLGIVLDTVLGYSGQTKPSLRQASAIWLLCLVQYCGNSEGVLSRLSSLQIAFKGFLADKDPLNQETASRGLTLVYEKGNRQVKDELVKDLIGSFTSSKSNLVGNVSGDTQLFEPGALPTGANSSVTTYKDIMHLANEVGDPSLVYRFMSLASNSSVWSSRAAFGRFGLSKILSDSSIDGYLAGNVKLYPALFRYRFDPNTNVRKSMNDIWFTLVKDNKTTVDQHFQSILEDLLKNIFAKEWRTREASCAAISDLLQGRDIADYETYLMSIWTATFKVYDDIKDSVRRAAMGLAQVLTSILIRTLEHEHSSRRAATAMLQRVLPFLMSQSGLDASAREVQELALATLRDIVKKGDRTQLRPFLGELIADRLLPLLNSLEKEGVNNYLHLNAEKYGITGQEIDSYRLKDIRMSPLMDTIDRCLDMLDETSVRDFVPRLRASIKTMIGLPSKVGSSKVLVTLSTRRHQIFAPFAAPFLNALRRQLSDRNETVSVSAATACGYLSRISADEPVLEHVSFAKQLYIDSEDDKHRVLSGEIMLGLAKHATDKFQSLSSSTLPFVFIAKHDLDEACMETFTQAWEEGMGAVRSVRLYLAEIAQLSTGLLDCPRWPVKHAASLAVADIIKSLGRDISTVDTQTVWPLVVKALSGKIWAGKEKVLEAFVLFAKNSSHARDDTEITTQFQAIVLRESKRKNTGIYRQQAIACLGESFELFPTAYCFDRVLEAIVPIVESLLDDAMDVDSESTSTMHSYPHSVDKTLANTTTTLLRSIRPTISQGHQLKNDLAECLDILERLALQRETVLLDAIFEGECDLFDRLATAGNADIGDELAGRFLNLLDNHRDAPEPTRLRAAKALGSIAATVKQGCATAAAVASILDKRIAEERSLSVQRALATAQTRLLPR